MTSDKDRKRLVRARMRKTGESYTTARRQLLAKQPPKAKAKAKKEEPAIGHAELAGMSEAAVQAKTGRTWAEWVQLLDAAGAHGWPHREIAAHVHDRYAVSAWWSQAVAVGYERIKGLRAKGQQRGGQWVAGRSRTFAVPAAVLFAAFRDTRQRRRWLGDVALTIRTAQAERSMRITWPDGAPVELWFVAKGERKTQVAVQHGKLRDADDVARTKAWWGERFDALAAMLQGG